MAGHPDTGKLAGRGPRKPPRERLMEIAARARAVVECPVDVY